MTNLALTAEERAQLATIAAGMEVVPALVDRLQQFLTAQRPPWTAVVRPLVPDTQDEVLLSQIDAQIPVPIDTLGRLNIANNRRAVGMLPVITIPAVAQVSVWHPVTRDILQATGIASWDAPGRLAAELINLELAFAATPDPALASADARTASISLHSATLGTVVGLSVGLVSVARWYRYRSAVPVGAGGRSFQLTFSY
jgi:hypothetical protein